MKNKYILDTSFISSLLKVDDTMHMTALETYATFDSNAQFYIPSLVIIELFAIRQEIGQKNLTYIIDFIDALNHIVVDINKNFIEEFRIFVEKNNLNLKPMDHAILFTACRYNAELITFDKKLYKIYQSNRKNY